jgi:methyltransferase (TIGR00027 family)
MNLLGSTADVCAALRTLSGTDPLAARMLTGPKVTTIARLTVLRPLLRTVPDRLVPGSYGYEAIRTRHVDSVVAAEHASGTNQLVLLGAGLDTRAHRFPLHTFEVDLPPLSRRKRALAAGLPGRVQYIEADLERDDIRSRLLAAGFDPAARALVLAIGLFMYVSPAAAERTLILVASFPPRAASSSTTSSSTPTTSSCAPSNDGPSPSDPRSPTAISMHCSHSAACDSTATSHPTISTSPNTSPTASSPSRKPWSRCTHARISP